MGSAGVHERWLHPLGRRRGQKQLLCTVVRYLPPPYFAVIFSSIFKLPISHGSFEMIMLNNAFIAAFQS
jgi:hypothetical protein